MASMILGSIGSSMLGPLGGMIGSALGGIIDQILFAPKPKDQYGPRLEDTMAVKADPGAVIPMVFGADRIGGSLIASTDLIETEHKKRYGGKFGIGGYKQVLYTYHVDCDWLICKGPILGVCRIWADGNLIRGPREPLEIDTEVNHTVGGLPLTPAYIDTTVVNGFGYEIPWTFDYEHLDITRKNARIANLYQDFPNDDQYQTTSTYYLDFDTPVADESELPTEPFDGKVTLYYRDASRFRWVPAKYQFMYTGEVYTLDDLPEPRTSTTAIGGGQVTFDNTQEGSVNVFFYKQEQRDEDGAGGTGQGSVGGTGLTYADFAGGLLAEFQITVAASPFIEGISGLYPPTGNYAQANVYVDFYTQDGDRMLNTEHLEPVFVAGYDQFDVPVGGSITRKYRVALPPLVTSGTEEISTYYTPPDPVVRLRVRALVYHPVTVIYMEDHFATVTVDTVTFTGTSYVPEPKDIRDWPDYKDLHAAINDWSPYAVLAYDKSEDVVFYPGTKDQLPDPYMEEALGEEVPAYRGRAHIVFKRLELEPFGNRIPQLTFEAVQSPRPPHVRDIILSILDFADFSSDDYNADNINPANYAHPLTGAWPKSKILGFSVSTDGTLRRTIEALCDFSHIDASEMNYKLHFRYRDRDIDHVIPYEHIGAIDYNEGRNSPVLKINTRDPLEMPRSVVATYHDPEREYQTNTAEFRRIMGPTVQQSAVEIPVVTTPREARKYARQKMVDVWHEKTSIKFDTLPMYVYVSVGDLVQIDRSSIGKPNLLVRVQRVNRGLNGVMSIEGVVPALDNYTGEVVDIYNVPLDPDNIGKENTYRSRSLGLSYGSVTSTALASFDVLDLPPLRVEDKDELGMYAVAVGVNSRNWVGAAVYEQQTASTYARVESIISESVIGVVTASPLPYVSETGTFHDDYHVDVRVAGDTFPVSITVNAFMNYGNVARIGSEIVCFLNATKIADKTYRLSGFIRGLLDTGTENVLASHAVGERFVMLDADAMVPVPVNSTAEGLRYKIVPATAQHDDYGSFAVPNTEARKRPFHVAQTNGYWSDTNEITVTWVRTDRAYYLDDLEEYNDIRNADPSLVYEVTVYEVGEDSTATFGPFTVPNDDTQLVYTVSGTPDVVYHFHIQSRTPERGLYDHYDLVVVE